LLQDKKIAIIILTLNAEDTIIDILEKIDFSRYRVLILDSSSTDKTLEICGQYNCEIKIINKNEFNHGQTREIGRKLINSDIVIFLTQDAIPLDSNMFNVLAEPIINEKASVSYARQIPKGKANIFESFPREYNYGDISHIRSIQNVDEYGVYTFFCSNSCAAWSNSALDDVGGFKNTLTNEDYFACAEILKNKGKVAYISKAIVTHSHNYSLKEEFQRMFDTGYVRAERPWVQDIVGTANKRGMIYFMELIKRLLIQKIYLIPYAILVTISKWLGFKIGYSALNFPISIKKKLSGQSYYFNSKYFTKYK
jgi:rhamnosyltransferase